MEPYNYRVSLNQALKRCKLKTLPVASITYGAFATTSSFVLNRFSDSITLPFQGGGKSRQRNIFVPAFFAFGRAAKTCKNTLILTTSGGAISRSNHAEAVDAELVGFDNQPVVHRLNAIKRFSNRGSPFAYGVCRYAAFQHHCPVFCIDIDLKQFYFRVL